MATPEKTAAVAEIVEDFRTANATVLTEYRGLSVGLMKQLRRSLGVKNKYSVVKNTLTKIAAKEAGVMVVDTTHSSSWPVSEWALALALIGLREHARFRDIIAGKKMSHDDYRTKPPARELTGKTVGMIGFGHIAWRLREFLTPFRNEILAYDPYAPRELADALDVNFASLEKVMGCDVVICLAPDTPKTRDMISEKELSWLKPGAVCVNVSR